MKVRLTKRFAEMINGVDLSRVHAGDVVDISPRDAGILLSEGWAMPLDRGDEKNEGRKVVDMPAPPRRAEAAEQSLRVRPNRGNSRQ